MGHGDYYDDNFVFTSQTSRLAQVLKLIGETYYATCILIFGS